MSDKDPAKQFGKAVLIFVAIVLISATYEYITNPDYRERFHQKECCCQQKKIALF